MKVKLKLKTTNNSLRTKEVEGTTSSLPKVGERFSMYSSPLTEGTTYRYISTSPVKEVARISDLEMRFKTQNSSYTLEVISL